MTLEEIRKNAPDATHYFSWWDGMHVFKRLDGNWYWLINGKWTDTELLKIYWFFGWQCKARYLGGPSHKLKPL